MTEGSGIGRMAHAARWFLFAKTADDRRRARYWNALAALRRSQMKRRTSQLDGLAPSIVEIPPARGFATCAPDSIAPVGDVVEEVRRMRARLPLGTERPYLLDHPISTLERSSPLLRFALDESVVASAARYLGLVPMLSGITILASPHVPGPASGSQLFHSDWEDVRQVKVFVHCSPVADDTGPLTAVAADASRRVKDHVGYRYGGPNFRLPDETVLPRVAADDVARFVGPPGSTTFIDTSACLHMGSRVEPGAGERLVVQFQYLTPPAFDLVLKRPYRPVDGLEPVSPVDRLVLG